MGVVQALIIDGNTKTSRSQSLDAGSNFLNARRVILRVHQCKRLPGQLGDSLDDSGQSLRGASAKV